MKTKTRSYFRAFQIEEADPYVRTVELRLFHDYISLIMENQIAIMSCADYFFCPLSFSYCSVGAFGATLIAGPIRLGHLLIGWRHGSLLDRCPLCTGEARIVAFGSNLSSGRNWWKGLCVACRQWVQSSSSQETFQRRVQIISRILNRLPDQFIRFDQYAGYEFSWSGDGLKPATKTRKVIGSLYSPEPFDVLIENLKNKLLTH